MNLFIAAYNNVISQVEIDTVPDHLWSYLQVISGLDSSGTSHTFLKTPENAPPKRGPSPILREDGDGGEDEDEDVEAGYDLVSRKDLA